MKELISFVFIWLIYLNGFSQSLGIQLNSEVQYPVNISALTPKIDVLGRNYVYVASNEAGVKIYDTSTGLNLVSTISVTELGYRPMSLNQVDTILYVCVGSHFNTNDPYGLVTINVANPTTPVVLDIFIDSVAGNGTGIVEIVGDYAYLGAMSKGLVVLDVSDPNAITFVSQLIPDISFPHTDNTQDKVNARGLVVKDSLVYLCYDAGGLRVINCSNIYLPVEIGQFANPVTFSPVPFNWPRAYNNIVLKDSLLFLAVDYCGIEVVNINDPHNPTMVSHWNPHGCPSGQWPDAPIHANELKIFPDCDLLFASTGKSEMKVLDISDPYNLALLDEYGSLSDTTGSWGIDVSTTEIYLTYVYVSMILPFPFVPFHSTWSGVKRLSFSSDCLNTISDTMKENTIDLYPNPAFTELIVSGLKNELFMYSITSIDGKFATSEAKSAGKITIDHLVNGYYFLRINTDNGIVTLKFLKEN